MLYIRYLVIHSFTTPLWQKTNENYTKKTNLLEGFFWWKIRCRKSAIVGAPRQPVEYTYSFVVRQADGKTAYLDASHEKKQAKLDSATYVSW